MDNKERLIKGINSDNVKIDSEINGLNNIGYYEVLSILNNRKNIVYENIEVYSSNIYQNIYLVGDMLEFDRDLNNNIVIHYKNGTIILNDVENIIPFNDYIKINLKNNNQIIINCYFKN